MAALSQNAVSTRESQGKAPASGDSLLGPGTGWTKAEALARGADQEEPGRTQHPRAARCCHFEGQTGGRPAACFLQSAHGSVAWVTGQMYKKSSPSFHPLCACEGTWWVTRRTAECAHVQMPRHTAMCRLRPSSLLIGESGERAPQGTRGRALDQSSLGSPPVCGLVPASELPGDGDP